MRSKFSPLLLGVLLLSSCSLNKTEESKKDRTMAQLNSRQYGQSVDELEKALRENPRDRSNALLLAMAHIGHANAELFQLLGAVLASQSNPPPDALARVRCGSEPWDSLKDKSVECVVVRVLSQVPEGPTPDMARSQELLRSYYPVPKATSSDVNFLAAYVELYRLLNRFRTLTSGRMADRVQGLDLTEKKFDDITTPEFALANSLFGENVREIKAMGDEFMHFFRRMKYSYSKLKNYTDTINGKPFLKYKKHELIFDEDMSVDRIVRFAILVLNDEKGATDQRLNQGISGALQKAVPQMVRIARQLRYVSGPTQAMDQLSTTIEFEDLTRGFLQRIGSQGRGPADDLPFYLSAEFDLATEILWENPPGIFGDFARAMRRSWDTESLVALSEYHRASAPDWQELKDIVQLWTYVRDDSSGTPAGTAMMDELRQRRENDENYLKFPADVNLKNVHLWLRNVLLEADRYEKGYLTGKFSQGVAPPADRQALVHDAWTRTKTWLEKNVLLYKTL